MGLGVDPDRCRICAFESKRSCIEMYLSDVDGFLQAHANGDFPSSVALLFLEIISHGSFIIIGGTLYGPLFTIEEGGRMLNAS